jgi:hypothetical protein
MKMWKTLLFDTNVVYDEPQGMYGPVTLDMIHPAEMGCFHGNY